MNYRVPNYGFNNVHLPVPRNKWDVGTRVVRILGSAGNWIMKGGQFIYQKFHTQAGGYGCFTSTSTTVVGVGVAVVVTVVTVAIALGVGLGIGLSNDSKTEPEWSYTGALNNRRYAHTSTLLQNGKVLVSSGASDYFLATAELYDPSTGTWTLTGSMNYGRYAHTASVLSDGNVLVAGGELYFNYANSTRTAELYNPSTGFWTLTGSMNLERCLHTATVLADGNVLIVGGYNDNNNMSNASFTAELYNPLTRSWAMVNSMNSKRIGHTATLLTNGYVLVAGGTYYSYSDVINSVELYNPSTRVWTLTSNMNIGRVAHTASLLADGKVLIAGGMDQNDVLNTTELYDPSTGTWEMTGNMNAQRLLHTASILSNGNVLVAGGFNDFSTNYCLNSAELYNPSTGAWTLTSNMNEARCQYAASVLQNGKVLVSSGTGNNETDFTNSAELYSY